MRPLKWRSLALFGGGAAAVTAVLSAMSLDRGAPVTRVPWSTLAVGVVLASIVLMMGWTVREYKKGKRPRIDPLRAVRTAMLAQASAYAGALLAGSYGAYALVLARDWGHVPMREVAVDAALAALGGVAMLVAGIVAERWCRISPDDDDAAGGAEAPEAGVAH